MSSKRLKLIAVDEQNYLILKRMGYTSESFNDLYLRGLLKNSNVRVCFSSEHPWIRL